MIPTRPMLLAPHRALAAALALALAGCGGDEGLPIPEFGAPETAVAYEVVLEGSPSDAVTDLAEESLSSYRLQDKGAASLAFLRRRAESDVPTLLKILRSRGYYSSAAKVAVEETTPGEAVVTITTEPGPAYTLTRHAITVEQPGDAALPALDAAALGSPVGKQALAADIAKAEGAAIGVLHRNGFPYAAYRTRTGLAVPEDATLTVDSVLDAGPAHTFGPVRFEGLETVEEEYLLTYKPWEDGETFDTEKLKKFQRSLFATDLFASATVRPPQAPDPDAPAGAPLPVTVAVEEGPPRRISGSLRYDTDLGPTARAAYEHRNLFGANERLLVQAEGGLYEQTAGIGLRKPQFGRPGQDLLTDLTFTRTTEDAYDALTLAGFIGVERKLSEKWTVGLGVLGEASDIDDDGLKETSLLLGVPGFARYDGSNDLLDPTRGARFRLDATPFGGTTDEELSVFLVLDAHGSYYTPLDAEEKYVLAFRGRAASILSENLDVVPPTRRLYSGGSGSVRGYALDFVGPLDDDGDPVGGRSALEAGAELRARLYGDFGGVVFAEAGSVSEQMFPDLSEGVQAAAGLGLRYYSPAGPIRFDVGVPLNPRPEDDSFQVYFSIGQAF